MPAYDAPKLPDAKYDLTMPDTVLIKHYEDTGSFAKFNEPLKAVLLVHHVNTELVKCSNIGLFLRDEKHTKFRAVIQVWRQAMQWPVSECVCVGGGGCNALN